MLEGRYARYAEENPAYELMFRSYAALARALALKCAWHEQAGEAVRSGDREKIGALATELPETIAAVDALRVIWRRLWESTNKPNGFEIIDVRLGGVCARLSTAMEKARAFAAGEAEAIPELCEESWCANAGRTAPSAAPTPWTKSPRRGGSTTEGRACGGRGRKSPSSLFVLCLLLLAWRLLVPPPAPGTRGPAAGWTHSS